MAIVVIGGHLKNIGKTSVISTLIAAMPERNWTAADAILIPTQTELQPAWNGVSLMNDCRHTAVPNLFA